MSQFNEKHKFILLLLFLDVLYVSPDVVTANKYCKLKCGLKHTMCRYEPGPNKQTCKDYSSFLSQSDKDGIVDIHNQIRSRVANGEEWLEDGTPLPPATNMLELKWDDELAAIAQRWADQCHFQHDKCRNTECFHVGQNIAFSTTKDENYATQCMSQFYKELEFFSLDIISGKTDSFKRFNKVGHYTQIIWATTEYVGCARVTYRPEKMKRNIQQVVCNYGPAGNVHGRDIYEIGEPCSSCPSGTNCNGTYPALCSPE